MNPISGCKVFATTLAASALLLAGAQKGRAQTNLCDSYTIQSGDTLSALSRQVFGEVGDFVRFYDDPRNVDSLGSNPNQINVGDILYLPPCEVSGEPLSRPIREVDDFERSIDIVTASDFAPFTDENLPDGGMLTRIVEDAFESSDLPNPVEIDFVNDWGSHLDTLLPKGKYSFGFPWYRPDCDNADELSEEMAARCDLIWSEPVFSVVIGFYAPKNNGTSPTDFADLQGTRICRPTGYFTFDLEQEGLVPGETIDLSQPPGVIDCFEALEDGEVDYVSINRFTAEKAIAEAGLTGLVAPINTIVSTQDLHLVAHPFDGDAPRWLDAFNAGLRDMKQSGRYAQISRRYLELHEEEIDRISAQ
jgi:polar amino acid transport system substrate-binding protein